MPRSHTELLPVQTLPAAHHGPAALRRHEGPHVAVIGAAGYIGSAVFRHLAMLGVQCTGVVRRPGALACTTRTAATAVRVVCADLDDPLSLQRALEGVDTIIHSASYIGPDPVLCDKTNRAGTERLADAASAAGIRKILYVSTIGVYGLGPHTRVRENDVIPSPVTAASTSKLAAERIIQQYEGTVLRPGFVYGGMNSPFLVGLAAITANLSCWVNDGSARISVISIEDLATATVAVALHDDFPSGESIHACHPDPVTMRETVSFLAQHGLTTIPDDNLAFDDAVSLAVERGLPTRMVDLVGHDHWYDATRLWSFTNLDPSRLSRIRSTNSVGK
jgi:nucleoside-diphosphate-sugar epimerase